MIEKLQISNFRGIAKLELEALKRVNLIVGANNAGKTSLLEAVALPGMQADLDSLCSLFRTGSQGSSKDFERWMMSKNASFGHIMAGGRYTSTVYFGDETEDVSTGAGIVKSVGRLHIGWHGNNQDAPTESGYHSHAISVHHRSPENLIPAFADAVRNPKHERQLEQLLNKIDNRIQSLRLDFADQHQFISIDMGLPERIPVSQAGQGIYRLTSIFSELLGHRPQVCLIDEIENGIHWSVLPVIWQGIAEIAEALDIQIFATTHSRECLMAAYEVFRKRAPSGAEVMDFSVIQLMRVNDNIKGRVLNGAHVEAAIENDIELR